MRWPKVEPNARHTLMLVLLVVSSGYVFSRNVDEEPYGRFDLEGAAVQVGLSSVVALLWLLFIWRSLVLVRGRKVFWGWLVLLPLAVACFGWHFLMIADYVMSVSGH